MHEIYHQKEAVKMPYTHGNFPLCWGHELFTLAGGYHYDNHVCLYLEYIHIPTMMPNLAEEHKSQ